jgi:hypothetical protein
MSAFNIYSDALLIDTDDGVKITQRSYLATLP